MVVTDPANEIAFTNELVRSPSAEQAVMAYTYSDTRDLSAALVKCLPRKLGGKSWHKGGTDPKAPEHLTVEFMDSNGNHVTTKHINRSGRAC